MIYVTGDTHAHMDIDKLTSKNWPLGKTLTKDDYVIILGDFGLIWDYPESWPEEEYWLDWLQDKPWTTLFVDGNHENFMRLKEFPELNMFGGIVQEIREDIYHLMRGEVYIIDGNKVFVMGGGYSIDKDYRVEGKSWWPEEIPSKSEMMSGKYNLSLHDWEVDYVFTHDAPISIREMIIESTSKETKDYVLPEYLEQIRRELKFKKWYFGHFHDDWQHDNYICLYNKILKLGDDLWKNTQ